MSEDSLLELDDGPRVIAPVVDEPLDLDLVDARSGDATRCVSCSALAPVSDKGICRACFEDSAPARAAADANALLGGIAQQSSADANAMQLSSVANGRATFGVGFNDASGYIEALRRGVAPATLREYVQTLQRTYKRKVSSTTSSDGASYTITLDGESFTAQMLIAGPRVSGEESVDSGASDVAIAAMKKRTAERKAKAAAKTAAEAQAKAEASKAQMKIEADEKQATHVDLIHGKLVAGSVAEGHGILIGWTGAGDMTRAQLLERLDAANCTRDWADDAKEPGVQLTRAVRAAAGNDYNCEQEKKKESQTAEVREFASRWMLVRRGVDGAQSEGASRVGRAFGEVALCVTLYTDKPEPELVFDDGADAALVEAVRAEFVERIGAQRYVASDVSRWLKDTLREHCESVRYGGNFYVPKKHREIAERLVEAFKTWGADWMDPPLPIATSDQLARGLANGLKRDVDDVLKRIEAQRKERRKADPEAEIGEVAAQSFMTQLRGVLASIAAYAPLLGESNVSDAREKVRAAMTELTVALDETTLAINERFSNIWDEVKRDIKTSGGELT